MEQVVLDIQVTRRGSRTSTTLKLLLATLQSQKNNFRLPIGPVHAGICFLALICC